MEPSALQRLELLAENDYREFSQRLIPDGKPLLGIRMPHIRSLGKEIAHGDWKSFLENPETDTYHEQTLLRAFVLAYADMPEVQRVGLVEEFLPHIDNWAVCDSFCATLRKAEKAKEPYMMLVGRHIHDPHPYAIRFSVVLLLFQFMDFPLDPRVLPLLSLAENDHYYVKMAVAWAAATAYTVDPQAVQPWLAQLPFSTETMRMAIQKIRDSRRVSAEGKEWAAMLRTKLKPHT
ncbi:MAG: DNA alkylation repair protein [Spirochaetae bacterium HGW-Spirochaetae-4]|nr:MAG: DNA alkylation repair protein [Spirochaetae bacterium HGW-Spirochaetae-4]HCS36369.1 DNA alkylation repair protein [Sphaerochaeta sp.]